MDEILQKFLDKAPAAVIVGATIARTIGDSTLDDFCVRPLNPTPRPGQDQAAHTPRSA
jgi:hypothetical protein